MLFFFNSSTLDSTGLTPSSVFPLAAPISPPKRIPSRPPKADPSGPLRIGSLSAPHSRSGFRSMKQGLGALTKHAVSREVVERLAMRIVEGGLTYKLAYDIASEESFKRHVLYAIEMSLVWHAKNQEYAHNRLVKAEIALNNLLSNLKQGRLAKSLKQAP